MSFTIVPATAAHSTAADAEPVSGFQCWRVEAVVVVVAVADGWAQRWAPHRRARTSTERSSNRQSERPLDEVAAHEE